jgi:hypothetical protein
MHLKQLQDILGAFGLFLEERKFGASIARNALCSMYKGITLPFHWMEMLLHQV